MAGSKVKRLAGLRMVFEGSDTRGSAEKVNNEEVNISVRV